MRNRIVCTLAVVGVMALLATLAPGLAQERGDDAERKSKNGLTSGTIDGVEVSITYGRPRVRGRTIWGELVPFGEVWRTGADEATTITFFQDVLIEGEVLAAGTYGLFTVPTPGSWTVIFNRVANQWGAYEYDASQDALRVEVHPASSEPVEEMTFSITGDGVVLSWAKLCVQFTVAAAAS